MELIFERSKKGHRMDLFPASDVPSCSRDIPLREKPLNLPQLDEVEFDRHYGELEKQTFGVNHGFYPLGSCTMKYNPAVNEVTASLPGFTDIHPLAPQASVQGALEMMYTLQEKLKVIAGMDGFTLQPAAGAHGEYTGLLLIRSYHLSRGDTKRNKIIVPDSAHGTNPASAAMAGYQVVSAPSNAEGGVDLEKLKEAVGKDTAGLMLTNPNTLGIFDPNILEITRIVHEAGGLCYYDGANLNAIVGRARPGDMGFDCVHLNLHKTFSTPHGGGGPGSGPVGCKDFLKDFLPSPIVVKEGESYHLESPAHSFGQVKMFYGNFLVMIRALTYILMLGSDGLAEASGHAVLNANYLMHQLAPHMDIAYPGICMHEFVMTLEHYKKETGVSALDVAKGLLDHGMHPPTMYFPLIVHEALMAEPTETENKETLDQAAKAFIEVFEEGRKNPEALHTAPHHAPIGRPDEVAAARHPKLKYEF